MAERFFKKEVQNSVNVEVSTNATVNIGLATGATSETVEVTADPIALNTTQPQLGSTVEPAVVAFFPGWGEKKILARFLKLA